MQNACTDVHVGVARAGGQGVYQFVATMLKSPAELERNSNEWERVALSICAATPKLSSAQVRTSAGRGLSLPRHGKNTRAKAAVVSPLRRDEHSDGITFSKQLLSIPSTREFLFDTVDSREHPIRS